MQGFLRCLLIYCYFRKVSAIEEAGTSTKRLEEVEEENAKLKEAVAKMEEKLRVLGQHSAVMECEAHMLSWLERGQKPNLENSLKSLRPCELSISRRDAQCCKNYSF